MELTSQSEGQALGESLIRDQTIFFLEIFCYQITPNNVKPIEEMSSKGLLFDWKFCFFTSNSNQLKLKNKKDSKFWIISWRESVVVSSVCVWVVWSLHNLMSIFRFYFMWEFIKLLKIMWFQCKSIEFWFLTKPVRKLQLLSE